MIGWLSGNRGFCCPLLTQAPIKGFIEPYVASCDHPFSGRIVDKVAISVCGVTNVDAFECGVGHLAALSWWDVDVCGASEDPEVGQVRDVASYQGQWYRVGACVIGAVVKVASA